MRANRPLLAAAVIFCFCASAQDLTSTDPKARIRAARALGKTGSESIPQLATLLKDDATEVRQEAVRSITSIGTQHSLDPLIAATLDNDPEVQLRAVDGIVNFYLPGYLENGLQRMTSAVRSRFERENTQVVESHVMVRDSAVKAIARLVTGGSAMEVRASAARAVGILRGKAALPELISALQIKDDTVIFESLIAIQKIREPSAGSRVLFLLRDLNERIQIAAVETAGILKAKEAVAGLQRVFSDSRSAKVRRSALGSLAMIADPSSRALFQQAFTDSNDGIRASAAEGYARLKKSEDRAMVENAFAGEKKMAPRLAQAFALVSMGKLESGELTPLSYLVNTLNSKAYRDVAQPYLTELARESKVRDSLHQHLRQGTRDEKIGIVRILAMSGDRSSVAQIETLTRDPDLEVAQEAIRSLRNLRARLG